MWYAILLAGAIGLDQLLKWWVTSHLEVGQSAPLLPGVVQLTRLHNTGAAWSSFSGKTGLLAAVTVVLLAAVVYLVVKRSSGTRWGSAPPCWCWAAASAT